MNNSMPWAYPSTGVVAPEATIDIGGGGIVATLLGWFMSYICLFDWLIWLIILMWLVEWLIAWSIDLILLILRIVIWSIDWFDGYDQFIDWLIHRTIGWFYWRDLTSEVDLLFRLIWTNNQLLEQRSVDLIDLIWWIPGMTTRRKKNNDSSVSPVTQRTSKSFPATRPY